MGPEPGDHGGEGVAVAHGDVADAPALPGRQELLGDLAGGPEREVRRHQRVLDREPGCHGGELGRRRPPVVGDAHHLDQGVELDVVVAVHGGGAHDGEVGLEGLDRPADLVAVAVRQRATEAGEADGVGVAGGVPEQRPAAAGDQDRQPALSGREGPEPEQAVVIPVVRHLVPVEQGPHDLDRLGQPRLAHDRRIEGTPRRLVLLGRVPGAEAELDPTAREVVERRHLTGQDGRGVPVGVQDQGAEADRRRGAGQAAQQGQGRHPVVEVVAGEQHVEPVALGPACTLEQRRGVAAAQLETEAEGAHGRSP